MARKWSELGTGGNPRWNVANQHSRGGLTLWWHVQSTRPQGPGFRPRRLTSISEHLPINEVPDTCSGLVVTCHHNGSFHCASSFEQNDGGACPTSHRVTQLRDWVRWCMRSILNQKVHPNPRDSYLHWKQPADIAASCNTGLLAREGSYVSYEYTCVHKP